MLQSLFYEILMFTCLERSITPHKKKAAFYKAAFFKNKKYYIPNAVFNFFAASACASFAWGTTVAIPKNSWVTPLYNS